MSELSRRTMLGSLSSLAVAGGWIGLNADEAVAEPGGGGESAAREYTLPPLGYAPDALEPHIDAQTMTLHHDKHHAGYVKGLNEALQGLSLVEAEDESEEALAAALLLRETLETPGRTAALVTPEASLARRTAAILERWGVDIAPSAGIPLTRTAPGSLLLLLARWIAKPADPVLLLAVLKHECVLLGRDPGLLVPLLPD